MPTQNSLNPVTSGGVWEALGQIDPSITIDAYPTEGSGHAVASGGVYDALALKQGVLTFDAQPTEASLNPVTSGGVYTAIQNVTIETDAEPTPASTNPVQSGGVYTAITELETEISGKQDTLTFDNTPTQDSTNPVTSGGLYTKFNDYVTLPAFGGAVSALNQSITQAKMMHTRTGHAINIPTSSWNNGTVTITANILGDNTVGAQYQVFPTLGEQDLWDYYGVYLTGVTAYTSPGSGYVEFTFKCSTTPAENLSFQVLFNRCELLN